MLKLPEIVLVKNSRYLRFCFLNVKSYDRITRAARIFPTFRDDAMALMVNFRLPANTG